jgi:hypothetical protein
MSLNLDRLKGLFYFFRRAFTLKWTKKMAYLRLNRAGKKRSGLTFNDMILQKMASDRRPILKIFADKWSVRDYVKQCIGKDYLPSVYFYSDSYLRSFPLGLPSQFALKATHCSGASVLVWEGAKNESSLPVTMKSRKDLNRYRLHPNSIDKSQLLNLANSWLDIDYSWRPEMVFPEWAYDGIPRGFIFEELLLDEGQIPQDFKFFVFNGRVKLIRVDRPDKDGKKSMAHFNPSWEPFNLEFRVGRTEKYTSPKSSTKAPENLEEMIAIAQKLSVGLDFLRVDLYSIKSQIYFGELTNYPSAGKGSFHPKSFNLTMGNFFRQEG